jgi:NADH-quinone oxidoreductase subunit J
MTGLTQALVIAIAALGGTGVYVLMPHGAVRRARTGGALCAGAVLFLWMLWFSNASDESAGVRVLFALLATATVASAVMTITQQNPVASALWFASVVIGTAGLFMVQNAQFLAAAIVIVYAGAIIVMFLFVIMLAQQSGGAIYDRIAREPALAVAAGSVLATVLISAALGSYRGATAPLVPSPATVAVSQTAALNPAQDAPQVAGLGAAIYTEHWLSLEVAGTILLVAMVGAIVIAARKERA